MAELSMDREFSHEIIERIEKAVGENLTTPAVARDEITKIRTEREEELSRFDELAAHLIHFGFEDHTHDADKAELGFGIPRAIFENELEGLISELQFIRRMVRLVSESSGSETDEIEIQSISTTDPFFWFLVTYGVAVSFGKLTTWGLDTWKKVEDIRQVRAQTSKLDTFSEQEVEKIFGAKIDKQIKDEVAKQAKQMTKGMKPVERKNELENGFRALLPGLLARLERGLVVDIRYLPPPISPEIDEEESQTLTEKATGRASEVAELASNLSHIEADDDPILKIEAANDE